MAEVHGHTGLLIGLLRSGVTGDDQVLLFLDLLCGREVGNRPSGLVERHALCVSRCIAVEVQLEGGPVAGFFGRPLGSAFRAVDGDFVHIDFSVATAVTLNWSRLATVTEVPRVMPSTSERKEMALRFVSSVSSFEQDASAATLKVMNKSFAFISYTLNG